MSGLKPFPVENWKTIAPAMKKSAQVHEEIAGLKPKGPLKHYWGWDSRLVGEDKPFSLFLASGIPFEVIDDISDDGWIFLSNEDARAVVEGRVAAKNKNLVIRNKAKVTGDDFIHINETLDDLFAFKQGIISSLIDIPYVEGNIPVIISWYPSINKILLWNVNEEQQDFTIMINEKINQMVSIEGLDVALVSIK